MPIPLILVGLGLLAVGLSSKSSPGGTMGGSDGTGDSTDDDSVPGSVVSSDTSSDSPGSPPVIDTPTALASTSSDQQQINLGAVLATIRHTEGTDKYDDPYSVLFGGTTSTWPQTDHPANLGWKGVQYTDLSGKTFVSTAAGAYQIIRGTWNSLGLPDFTPANQDAAAVKLIQQKGAYNDALAGNFQAVMDKLGSTWASLPTSTVAQPKVNTQTALAAFLSAGGQVASAAPSGGVPITTGDQLDATQIDLAMSDPDDDSNDGSG